MEFQRRAEIEGEDGPGSILREGYLARETEATMREHHQKISLGKQLYFLYIRGKYQFWKLRWKLFPPKGHPSWTRWHETPYDLIDKNAVAIGTIYSLGFSKTKFNPKEYTTVAYRSNRDSK